MNAPASLTINRLRSRLPAREPVVARLALETLAAEVADAQPPLPPQSVLVIRQLALTVPGLSLARLPDSAQRAETARSAYGLLSSAWSLAARPAHGEVSQQASAVLFGDQAELLACIARDGLAGRLDCWWWRTLLGSAYPDWRHAWMTRPDAAPAALRLLARAGLEIPVLRALNAPATAREKEAQAEYDVPGQAVPIAPKLQAQAASDQAAPAPPRLSRIFETEATTPTAPPAHEAEDIPPRPVSRPLARPQIIITPVGAREPRAEPTQPAENASPRALDTVAAEPDTPPLVQAETSRHSAEASPQSAVPSEVTPATFDRPDLRPFAPTDAANAPPSRSDVQPLSSETATLTESASQLQPAVPDVLTTAQLSRPPRLVAEIARLSAGSLPPQASLPPGSFASPTPVPAPATGTEDDASPWPLDASPVPVRSRHARLFFLVNLMLGDGLYPDFTQPALPGFPVPIWRLLALLGVGLAGRALRDDPLWALLYRLGDELPVGDDCAFDRDWPIPAGEARRRPLALRHARPHGFERWLAAYQHSLRQRLAAALHRPPALLGRAFRQERGEALVWVSAADIVVVHSLDDHPVEWRLAGLDRDPGFLPGAGRTLRFVFQ